MRRKVASGKRNLRYRYHDSPPRCRQRYRGRVATAARCPQSARFCAVAHHPAKAPPQSPRHPKAPAHNAPAHSGCQPNPPPLHSGSRAHRPTHGGPPPCRPAYPPCRHPHPPARLGYGQRTSSGRAGPSAIWFCWGAGAGRPALPLPPLMLPRSGPPPALRWLRPVLVALRVVRLGLVSASRFRWFCHLFVGIFWGCVGSICLAIR